jgi:hypothetical protein
MMLVQCFMDRGFLARLMASLAVCLPGDTKLDWWPCDWFAPPKLDWAAPPL